MRDTIFREYDIRGKIDSEFDINQTYDLTRAIAAYVHTKNPALKTVVVGMDGRLSSPAIKEHMIAALRDSGLNVIFIGICPSPVLYFALYQRLGDAGLMITASHNPKEYNGIKILLGTQTIWGAQIKEIRDWYRAQRFLPLAKAKGTVQEVAVVDIYIQWLHDHFETLINMPLSAVIDCGNAAGAAVMPKLVKKMQWQHVLLLCAELDGTYPNHEADPTVEKNMIDVKNTLATTNASIGIGLDGDADRMAAMTKSGFLIPGDQLLAVFAYNMHIHAQNTSVVFDVKASMGLIELLNQWGMQPIMSPCGHANIKEQMKKHAALLGGELSCHFFFADRYFGYDDGIYAMLRLFEILLTSGKSLDTLLALFPKKYSSPEIRLTCAEEKKQEIITALKKEFESKDDVEINTIDGIRVTFTNGWANIRASNTQPVLSMRFEADSATHLTHIKNDFVQLLVPYFDMQLLKKQLQ
jgi:phosphomannomutase / phosphoglucomutase